MTGVLITLSRQWIMVRGVRFFLAQWRSMVLLQCNMRSGESYGSKEKRKSEVNGMKKTTKNTVGYSGALVIMSKYLCRKSKPDVNQTDIPLRVWTYEYDLVFFLQEHLLLLLLNKPFDLGLYLVKIWSQSTEHMYRAIYVQIPFPTNMKKTLKTVCWRGKWMLLDKLRPMDHIVISYKWRGCLQNCQSY